MGKRIEGFPDQLTIIGWRPMEFPLAEGNTIQVGVQLPTTDRTRWRPEGFTVFTLPCVDELQAQLTAEREARKLACEALEDGCSMAREAIHLCNIGCVEGEMRDNSLGELAEIFLKKAAEALAAVAARVGEERRGE